MLYYTKYELNPAADWVTFIHGAGGSSSVWFKQVQDFQKYFNVLVIDLRGHGKSRNLSQPKSGKYSFKMLGDEVLEVLDYLKIESTHFVGVSLGTIIIREITERHPERVKSLIMAGAVMKLNLLNQFLLKLGNFLKSIIPYMILYRIFAHIILPRRKHRESRKLFIKAAKKMNQKEFKRWFSLTTQINDLLRFFRLNDTGKPNFYIMGSEDYLFLPSVQQMARNHKSSDLFVIPNCGHVVNVEQPQIFNQKSLDFLRKLE